MCVDLDRVDRVSKLSTCAIHLDFHPTLLITPRVLKSKKIDENNPTQRKRIEGDGYIKWTEIDGLINCLPIIGRLIHIIINYISYIKIMRPRHILATQASGRVHVSLPRGSHDIHTLFAFF